MAGNVPDWTRTNHKKSSTAKVSHGIQKRPIFHGEHVDNPLLETHEHTSAAFYANGGIVRKYADGMLVDSSGSPVMTSVSDPSSPLYIDPETRQLKREGVEAERRAFEESTKDMGGFDKFVAGLKRAGKGLTSGSIDDPGSDAYWNSGAGRGQIERDKVRDAQAIEAGKANAGPRDGDADQWAAARKPMTTTGPVKSSDSDISSKPSREYSNIDDMKLRSVTKPDTLPRAEDKPSPTTGFVNPSPEKKKRNTRLDQSRQVVMDKAAKDRLNEQAEKYRKYYSSPESSAPPDNTRLKSKASPPSTNNDARKSKATKPSVDNEDRKSKPYPEATNRFQAESKRENDKADAAKESGKKKKKSLRSESDINLIR